MRISTEQAFKSSVSTTNEISLSCFVYLLTGMDAMDGDQYFNATFGPTNGIPDFQPFVMVGFRQFTVRELASCAPVTLQFVVQSCFVASLSRCTLAL